MKSLADIQRDLEDLVATNYYSETADIQWAVRQYEESLSQGERDLLRRAVVQRLRQDRSITSVIMVGCWKLPEAVPVMTAILDEEARASMLSRELLRVLGTYADAAAARAIERFIDSEQEIDALMNLARVDFVRAVPHVRRALRKPHMGDCCLHLLAERSKAVGLEAFLDELADVICGPGRDLRARTAEVLDSKSEIYNPFRPEERQRILVRLGLGAGN